MGSKSGWTKVSNFAELREKLTPEPEKVVHNFLADVPPRKPSGVPVSEPVSKVGKPSRVVSEHASVALNKGPKARKVQGKQKKKKNKSKPPRHDKRPNLGEVARGRSLYRQIVVVDRKIEWETKYYEISAKENRFYDGTALRRLISEREALAREYVRLKDPLGLLLPLPSTNKINLEKRKGKVEAPKKKPTKTESLEELRAVEAYYERARQEAERNPAKKWPTERRFWWNEE